MAAATWNSLASTKVPGKDLLKSVRNVLETLLVYLEVVKAFLDTVRVFLIDFGNPIKVIVFALLKLIDTLIEALKRQGVYALLDFPNPFQDPKFTYFRGGYQGFKRRWKGSLLDSADFNRPQPISGATIGGYVIILADVGVPEKLMRIVRTLRKLFANGWPETPYQPPTNVRAVPVGTSGDPILSVTKVFTDDIQAVAVEWSMASSTPVGDSGFQGMASSLVDEFIPSKWLVERSETPLNTEILGDELNDAQKVGILKVEVETNLQSTVSTPDTEANKPVKVRVPVLESNGDPYIKFQKYAVVSVTSTPTTYILGQLGTFRWIDTNIERGKIYYYRVRAYSGKLAFETLPEGDLKFSPSVVIKSNPSDDNTRFFEWPSAPSSSVDMGRASNVVQVKLPQQTTFDVINVLRATFLAGFSFNFHLPPPDRVQAVGAGGKPATDSAGDPVYKPQWTATGDPIAPVTVEQIGQGSLMTLSGSISSFMVIPYLSLSSGVWQPNPATGKYPEMPWITRSVRFAAARNTVKFAGVFLDTSTFVVDGFRKLMQGPLPYPITVGGTLAGVTTLEQMVYALTKTTVEQSVLGQAVSAVTESSVLSTLSVDRDTAATFGTAFSDANVRKNLLAAVNYLLAIGGQGEPPNWIQINVLRDLVPWAGKFLYEMRAKIVALYEAFKGALKELEDFINLIIRKINKLEAFIRYLIEILNYIEQLSAGVYILNVTGLKGGVDEWFSSLDSAGNAPTSGAEGYTGSISFAYLTPNGSALYTAFKEAFGIIF